MTNTTNVNTNTSAEETKIAVVGGVEIPVPAHLSIDQIREGLAHAYPSIQGSKAIEEDGYVRFFKEAGEKGSDDASESAETKIAVVGGVEIPVPAHLSVDQIREGLAHAYPSIQGSKAIEEDGYVRFFKEAGEKGSDDNSSESTETKIAVVGGVEIPVPAHLSIDEIREGLAHAYPSIQGSKAIEEDGYVRFFKEAGEKGSDDTSESAETKIAVVGGVEIPVPAHLSIDEIREGLAHAYPSIQGSKAIEEDGYVRFFKEAGEKGSDDASESAETKIAVVGGVEIPVPAHLSIDEIREGLAHAYPSIQGSKAIEEDGYVRFFKEAGEKGSDDVPEWVQNAIPQEDSDEGETEIPEWVSNALPQEPEMPEWVSNALPQEPEMPEWVSNAVEAVNAPPAWVAESIEKAQDKTPEWVKDAIDAIELERLDEDYDEDYDDEDEYDDY